MEATLYIWHSLQLLTSEGLAPATYETIQKVKSKHPSRCFPLQDLCCDDKQQLILTKSSVSEVLQKAPRGSSCGPFGWRYEHFKFMQDNHSTFDSVHSVCALIADGNVPPNIIPLLSAS